MKIKWPILKNIISIFLLYYLTAMAGLLLATVNHKASPVWPATGIAIAALWYRGIRYWPVIWLAAFLANFQAGETLIPNFLIGLGNALEGVCGYWIIYYFSRRRGKSIIYSQTILVLTTSYIPPFVSATIGNLVLIAAKIISWSDFSGSWTTWWVGDFLGALVVVPFALELGNHHNLPNKLRIGLLGGLRLPYYFLVVCFASMFFYINSLENIFFCIFLLLLIPAMQMGALATYCSSILIMIVGFAATVQGRGIFSSSDLNNNLIHLQFFLAAVAVTSSALPRVVEKSSFFSSVVLVLIFGWGVAGSLFNTFRSQNRISDRARFDRMVAEAEQTLRKRIDAYEDVLRACASLFMASTDVNQTEWRVFVDSLSVFQKYPGVDGIGVIFPVKGEDLEGFAKDIRREIPDFTVHPIPGQGSSYRQKSEDHFVIKYLESPNPSPGVIGLDISSEINRRTGAILARDRGHAVASDKINLIQSKTNELGFLFYFPFYQIKDTSNLSAAERRKLFRGFIYAPFATARFFSNVLEPTTDEIAVNVFDDDAYDPKTRIFCYRCQSDIKSAVDKHTSLRFGDKLFYLQWQRTEKFISTQDYNGVWIAFCGSIIVLLISSIIAMMQSTNARASALAKERTAHIENLEKANHLYRIMIEDIEDYAIVFVDENGDVKNWNEGAARLYGYQKEEIVGRNFSIFFPKFLKGNANPHLVLEETKREGKTIQEGWLVRRDGSRFWGNLVLSRVIEGNGGVQGYAKITRDRSEEREREQRLQSMITSLRMVSSATNIGFFSMETDTNAADFSDEFSNILGMAFTRNLNENFNLFLECLPVAWRSVYVTARQRFFNGDDEQLDIEVPITSPRHGKIWIRLFMYPRRKAGNKPVDLFGYCQNITERKNIENRATASESRLKYALEGSSDGLWDWDLLSGEMFLSEQLADLFGSRGKIVISSVESMRSTVHPDDFDAMALSIDRHLKGESDKHESQARLLLKDGSWRWFLTRGKVSEFDEHSRPKRITGVHIDISRLKGAEMALEQSTKQLQMALASKSQFLATMSHEIRTPLNGVIGLTDLLLDTRLDLDQMNYARLIKQSGSFLMSIVNDILDFSKIEDGKMHFERIEFCLSEVVEDHLELLQSRSIEKGLRLQSFLHSDLELYRFGDPGRIGQIILNLVGNAIKFTEKGGISVRVLPAKGINKGLVRFEVSDTGIGIEPNLIPSLFQPFVQGDNSTSRKYGGTGLGLSICKRLVQLMHGSMGVDSSFGDGSTFWFEVELEVSTENHEKKYLDARAIAEIGRVGIVSKNQFFCETVAGYLQSWGLAYICFDEVANLTPEILKEQKVGTLLLDEIKALGSYAEHLGWLKQSLGFLIASSGRIKKSTEIESLPFASIVMRLPVKRLGLYDTLASLVSEKRGVKEVREVESVPVAAHEEKILIAEDNQINQQLIVRLVENLGYRCQVVSNGLEVLDALTTYPFDLILMDCQMPILDGYEATIRIRKLEDERLKKIPIVALTANARPEDEERCRLCGMDDFLSKPIRKAKLLEKIQLYLSKSDKA